MTTALAPERILRAPIAGMLVTLAAILAIWGDNMRRLPFEGVWPTLAAGFGIAGVVVVALRLVLRSWAAAEVASVMIAIYCFYVPSFVELVALPGWAMIVAHGVAIVLLYFLGKWIVGRQDRSAIAATNFRLVAVLLLLITAVPIIRGQISLEGDRAKRPQALAALHGTATASSPDVWHILFDRYAGTDTLRSTYAFDNRPFVEALRARGFTVHDQAFANYQRTAHSVASTMNGSLLDPLGRGQAQRGDDWVPIYRAMRDSAAVRAFNRMGYHTVHAGSWWEPTRQSGFASESIEVRTMPQLARLAIDSSAIGFWSRGFSLPYFDGRKDQCFRASEKFRRLSALTRSADPKHVFAHFLVPHPPFVLNSDGSCRSVVEAQAASRRDNYLAQLRFANREALTLVDAILAGPRPAVIVVHSDEGPWPAPYVGNEHGLGTDPVTVPWASLPDDKLKEKMSILLAVRGPDGPPATMPTSPVQIYPAILRDHFGSTQALPVSRHYVFASDRELYRFEDVSAKLQP